LLGIMLSFMERHVNASKFPKYLFFSPKDYLY